MLLFVIPLLFTYTTAYDYENILSQPTSAASEGQIKFAIENKYDDTGPGAKKPETAYNTYSNLVDALVGYIDDPDTKLPEHEKSEAIHALLKSHKYTSKINHGYVPKQGFVFDKNPYFSKFYEQNKFWNEDQGAFRKFGAKVEESPLVVDKYVTGRPLSVEHYSRDAGASVNQHLHDPHPRYSFSYNVDDNQTGDSKAVQETRDGGNVIGFYSFKDADGKTRTVHYTAYGKEGFKAVVESIGNRK